MDPQANKTQDSLLRLREIGEFCECGGSVDTGGLGEMCSGLFGDGVVLVPQAVAVVVPIVAVELAL